MTILPNQHDQPQSQPNVNPKPDLYAVATYDFPSAMLARLQQETGWDTRFTLGAVNEYRRFVQLAATASQQITPSQVVDEVWHTHLMFTRDYWEKFMRLLPAPLHHEPGTGAADDAQRFTEQYLQTLNAYRQTFGAEPPAEFWPDPRQNARPRVPPAIRRQRGHSRWRLPVSLAVGFAAYLMSGTLFLTVFFFIFALIFTSVLAASPAGRGSGGDGGGFLGFGGDNSSSQSCDSSGSDSGSCSDGGSSCGGGCGGGCGT